MQFEYAQQDVHASRPAGDVRPTHRSEKAKSMTVLQVETRYNEPVSASGSLINSRASAALGRGSPQPGSPGVSVKGRTKEWEKKETQDVLKKWRGDV
jgi:hypothetical protein